MEPETDPKWLAAIRELMALSQTGVTYAENPFDHDRYVRVQELAAELLAARTGAKPEAVLPLFRTDTGYATPKIGVRGAVFDGQGRVLMVREADEGLWALPGGWCEVNQTAAEAVEREVQEESGLIVRAVRLARVYDHRLHNFPLHAYHHYLLFFICELMGGAVATGGETDAAGWFGETELPALSNSRVTQAQVRDMFRHYRDAGLATEFDASEHAGSP